jgi:hypothetical protein
MSALVCFWKQTCADFARTAGIWFLPGYLVVMVDAKIANELKEEIS